MSSIAHEMLPDGGYITRCAEECSEPDKEKVFHCVHCGVRVYLHLPEAENEISPYFSAGAEPHEKGCPDYKKDLFQTVAHLDHTGYGVDLGELMKAFRQVDRRPRTEGGKGKESSPKLKTKEDSEEEDDRLIRRETRTPRTIIQLYGILKDPAVTEYAGHDAWELIVDKSTISYYYEHDLNQTALVVGGRCMPPPQVANKLRDKGIYERSLTIKAPYKVPDGQKNIYYVLVFQDLDKRQEALDRIWEDSKKAIKAEANGKAGKKNAQKVDDKYLAMASWKPYFQNDSFSAYIGCLPNTGCFKKLPPKYDCDED